jgi:hypothetical protein
MGASVGGEPNSWGIDVGAEYDMFDGCWSGRRWHPLDSMCGDRLDMWPPRCAIDPR